jgi:protein-disulfide isomerase
VTRKQIYTLVGIAIVLLLVVGGYYYLATNGTPDTQRTNAGPGFIIVKTDRTLGNPKAPVTLIEYAAPSCPICAAFNHDNFALLKQNYIDTGKVFYVLRVFPIREDDGTAEKIARCLPADNYIPFIDQLFRNQSKWDVEFNPGFSEKDVHDALIQQARIAGMGADEANKCIANKAEDERINAVAKDGMAKYNITGTPTFVINGVNKAVGNMTWQQLQNLLDNAAAAKK